MNNRGVLEVILFSDGKFVGSMMFTSSRITIGRHPRSMVRLDDSAVSTQHAILHFKGDAVTFEDLGSRNGTLVNGQPVARASLRPIDEVEIGPYRLKVVYHPPDEDMGVDGPVPATQQFSPAKMKAIQEAGRAESARRAPEVTPDPFHDEEHTAVEGGTTPGPWDPESSEERTNVVDESIKTMRAKGIEADLARRELARQGSPMVDPEATPRVKLPAQETPRHDYEPLVTPRVPLGTEELRHFADVMQGRSPAPVVVTPTDPVLLPGAIDQAQSQALGPVAPVERKPPPDLDKTPIIQSPSRPLQSPSPQAIAPTPQPSPSRPMPIIVAPTPQPPSPSRPMPIIAPTPQAIAPTPQPPSPSRQVQTIAPTPQAQPPSPSRPMQTIAAPPSSVKVELDESTIEPPTPTPVALAGHDEEDDEDDHFVPTFSLVEVLGNARPPGANQPVTVEAIVHRDGQVLRIKHLAVGDKLRLGDGRTVCKRAGERQLSVAVGQVPNVELFEGGRALALSELVKAGDGRSSVNVAPGGHAVLHTPEGDRIYLHFVATAPPPPKGAFTLAGVQGLLSSMGSSVGVHLAVFALFGLTAGVKIEEADLNEGRYAKIAMKDLELQPPPPEPPPPKEEPPPPEPPPPPIPQPNAKQSPVPQPRHAVATHLPKVRTPVAAAAGPPTPGPPKPSAAANKLLNALGGGSLSASGPSSSPAAVGAMTNLDAVSAPHAGGGFKVSGAIGKMPGDQLRLAAAGSGTGRVDTKTVAELTHGGSVGRVAGPSSGNGGRVRALVTSPPARTVEVQGELDRGEIQKVVNAHLREVQGCYERQLIKEPSLSGKIIFEWVITTSGSVGMVRVKFSDLRATAVTTCIQSSIRNWQFPQPRGGNVTVTYPFVFSTMGI